MHIGGGEPFLKPEKLLRVVEIFKEEKISISYIETNSSWYQNLETAVELLEDLMDRGISSLLISASPFHNEYIPFNRVKGVIRACEATGMQPFIWIDEFYNELDAFDDQKRHKLDDFVNASGSDYLRRLPHRYWTSPGGRALNFIRTHLGMVPLARILRLHASGCEELSMVDHYHMDLYGNYIPGLCAGLSIRREDLGNALDPDVYPILTLLHSQGIRAFLQMACKKYDFQPKSHYANKCDLCFDIRRFFVIECGMRTFELQPVYHYLEATSDE